MPDDTEDSTQPRTPGAVPSEGRTISRPAPAPAHQFADWLNQQLGRTR